jgi:multicomponent Na+:H+ antiporter subunit B
MRDSAGKRGMSGIVRTVARWLETPILVYGIYTVLYGHIGPGGGFAGGVMIATGLTLRTLAEGVAPGGERALRVRAAALASGGALLFLAAAFLGAAATGSFLGNVAPSAADRPFSLLSGGLIVVYEIGIALLVSGGLTGAVSALDEIQHRLLSGDTGREGA